MALQPEQLFDSYSRGAAPRLQATTAHPRDFKQVGAAKTLPVGTAVAMVTATGFWVEFDPAGNDGSEEIRGFVYDVPVTLSTSGEVVGTVMLAGWIHRDDIVADGATSNQLEAALRAQGPSMREKGFDIVGLTKVP